MKQILQIIFMLPILLLNAEAQLYMEENFTYGSSSDSLTSPLLTSSNVWRTHSGSVNQIMYQTSGLTYAGYSSGLGGSASLANGSGSRQDINRIISPSISAGNVYVSFLMNVSVAGGTGTTSDYIVHLNDTNGNILPNNVFRGRVFVRDGSVSSTFQLGFNKGSSATAAVWTTNNYALNTTHLVVIKYVFRAGTNTDDSLYAWIFSSGIPSIEPPPMLVATDMTLSDFTKIGSVCLRQGGTGITAAVIDGIRVAGSWNNAPLPVQWGGFEPRKRNQIIDLNWSTLTEINNSHFEVERSYDANVYEIIGMVKGNGNSNVIQNYIFTDEKPLLGATYYRIKQVDFDGAFSYSDVREVASNETIIPVITTPNPFQTTFTLQLNNAPQIPTAIELVDLTGKVKYYQLADVKENNSQFDISVIDLPAGIYYVRVSNALSTTIQRVVKQ